jgi:ABC-2 type transport system ATP-binding protein
MPIIQVSNLVKVYSRTKRQAGRFGTLRTLVTRQVETTRALDGVDFSIGEGDLVGYIGPNGAGKSTTIKLLTGILVPTSGEAEVAGVIPWRERERNALNMGVVFGQRSQLWWDLPLMESFKLIGMMYRVPAALYQRNLDRFISMLAMEDFLTTPVRQLSLGQRMRGDLTAALLYAPRIVYLDEPTIGLDVVAKERIRDFIAEINRDQGTTVILTTHDLNDVERLCRRIMLIDHGRIIYQGTVNELKALHAPYRVLVTQLAPHETGSRDGPTITVPGAEMIRREGSKVWLRFDPLHTPAAALIADLAARYPVLDLSLEEPELEQVVRQIYDEHASA